MPSNDARPIRRPDLFVVGAPKCGTTTLYHQLRSHPEVFMSRPKEPSYFAAERYANWHLTYPDDEARYLELFRDVRTEKRVGEATTSYLESPLAAGRIHEFAPDARIVAVLRDPVAMLASLHGMRVAQGHEPLADLGAALEAERDRPGFGVVGDQSAVHYRDRARFGAMLPAWFETFGRERVHVMLLEDAMADQLTTFRRLLEFLDVDPTFEPDFGRRYNTAYRRRSQGVAGAVGGVQRLGMPNSLAYRLTHPFLKIIKRTNRTERTPEPVKPEVRELLQRELADDVARASELLGRDLAAVWWRPAATAAAS